MIVDPDPGHVALRSVGDVPDLASTPASDEPTAPDAPVPGAALEPTIIVPPDGAADAPEDDALSLLQRRVHPFS